MSQGRSTKIVSMMEWIRTSRLSIKICLSCGEAGATGAPSGPKPDADTMLPFWFRVRGPGFLVQDVRNGVARVWFRD